MELPQIGDYFCNHQGTEIYKIVHLSGLHTTWVDVLDFRSNRYWRTRPYSTIRFLKEMIAVSATEVREDFINQYKVGIAQAFHAAVMRF